MSLRQNRTIGFIPVKNTDTARAFYADTLGLTFVKDDQFALVFRVGPDDSSMLRVVRAGSFTPAPFTIFGWEVEDIHATVSELAGKGVEFSRFDFLEQDQHGVWTSPDGSLVAWFKDPDSNLLSLSCHLRG